MRAQMNAAKAKQDCAIEERNRFESLAKKSQEEMKKMAASKAIIEKQFLFDLKKERKTSAAAQPKSHAGMTSKFEARSNLRAEKVYSNQTGTFFVFSKMFFTDDSIIARGESRAASSDQGG